MGWLYQTYTLTLRTRIQRRQTRVVEWSGGAWDARTTGCLRKGFGHGRSTGTEADKLALLDVRAALEAVVAPVVGVDLRDGDVEGLADALAGVFCLDAVLVAEAVGGLWGQVVRDQRGWDVTPLGEGGCAGGVEEKPAECEEDVLLDGHHGGLMSS